ncbi:MAG: CPBP family intramembrane metalloprotease [Clostridia bacterium]|nr:CPBP family intramembrane metalloprotease [Clostridia bacterium]
MSNPKGRTIPDTITMYLVILVLYCLDAFFIMSDRSVLGDAFYSRVAGLLVLFGYIWITKDSIKTLGISTKKKKLIAGGVYGTLFTVIPLFLVMVGEAIYFGITDITALDLKFSPPSMSFVRDIANLTPAAAILIYIFTSFVQAAFKEFAFRGYILKKLKKVLDFKTANILQAVLYMFMTIPMLLRNWAMGYYDEATSSLIIFIIFFYIIHETLAGIKWGLLTRVSGSTNIALVDHFLFVFLSNSIYITDRYVTWSFMTHMLAIQVLSFALALIYYKKNMKKLEEKRAKEKEESKAKKKAHEEARKEREKNNIVDEKIKEINEISPDQYKSIVEETNSKHHKHHHHHSEEYYKKKAEYNQKRNETNSAHNESLFENVSTADASKAADKYLSDNLNRTHHHHHHHSSHSTGGREIESFSTDDISKKTAEFSDSLSLERKMPKHPHPHDTIARDGRLSAEELDKANEGKAISFEENDIDTFLKNFSEDMSKPSHRYRSRPAPTHESANTDDISEGFNADSFLKDFQRREEMKYRSDSSEHHHHHHHSSSHHHHYSRDDEVVSMNDVSTENFYDEYQKTVEEKKEKSKQSFMEKLRELGKLDDSDSNDLI